MSSSMSETPLKRFEPNYPKIHNESEMTDLVSKLTGNLQIIFNKHTTISVNAGGTCVTVRGPTSYLFNLPKKWDSVSFTIAGDDPNAERSSFDCTVDAIREPENDTVYQIQIDPNAKTVGTDVNGVMDLTYTQSTE